MVTALEPLIDDVTARYEAPTEFVLPGENRTAAALDVARAVVRRAERCSVAAAHEGWLTESHVVPYLNRLADLVYTLARWQEGTFRPVRADRDDPTPESPEPTGVTVPLSFTVVTTSADRVAAELLAVPIGKGAVFGPGADAVDAALDGGLAAFLAEAGFDGKLGETLAVPTAGRLRAKAAVLVGIGDPAELTVDGLRRAAAAVARRASKAASVATTLATVRARAGGGRRGPGRRRRLRARLVPVPGVQGRRVTHEAEEGLGHRGGRRRSAQRGQSGRDGRGRGHVGARHGEHAVEGEVAGRDGDRAAQAPARAAVSRVQVLDVKQLEAQRLGGVLGVGQGSEQSPRFLKMTYAPSGARGKALALVGKGVVFDSGGLSLKTGRRHGDDEDRHVRWRGGDRGDVGARRPRREDAVSSATCRWSRTCRAAPPSAPATCCASATARPSRCSTPTPRVD